MTPQITPQTFDGLGIAPKILEILDRLNFKVPTPIQHQSIPTALEGKDVMGIAQTGTGKTLAFGIPMLQRLAITRGRGLVVLPTRELALQVNEALTQIGRPLGLKTAVLIGGESIGKQMHQLNCRPHIIVATPGRLIDHLQQKTVDLDKVVMLILDEADRMLDMGFEPQLKRILQSVPKERQTLLFSATMPSAIVEIAKSYMQFPVRVEMAPAGTTATNITHEIFFVRRDHKMALLETLMQEYKGSALIFSRTKFGAKKISLALREMGHRAAELHSDRSLGQRKQALSGFKTGYYRVLVATDIASRGIDVENIELVINYDLPEDSSDYVHRVGRTGRAGHSGHAISFVMPEQKRDVFAIERLIKKQLPVSPLPEAVAEKIKSQATPMTPGWKSPTPARTFTRQDNFRDKQINSTFGASGQWREGGRHQRREDDRPQRREFTPATRSRTQNFNSLLADNHFGPEIGKFKPHRKFNKQRFGRQRKAGR